MPERHLECPGDACPEAEGSEKRGREAEVFLDEEGADDAGQARDPGGHVDHERGQVRKPQLPPEFEDIMVYPAVGGGQHIFS